MATETGFLDLMAYARGAQLANTENQADATFALKQEADYFKMLADQAQASRTQQLFDTTLPYVQAGVKDRMRGFATAEQQAAENKQVAQGVSDMLREAQTSPVEGQAGLIAARLDEKFKTATPGELERWAVFGRGQADAARRRGDLAGMQAILNVLPGQNAAEQAKAPVLWNDPTFARDPQNVKDAGGELLPGDRVLFGGRVIPLWDFAQMAKSRAENATFNTAGVLSTYAAQGAQQAQTDAEIAALDASLASIGKRAMRVGNAIQLVPLQPVNAAAAYPDVPAARGASSFAPPATFNPSAIPPGGVAAPPAVNYPQRAAALPNGVLPLAPRAAPPPQAWAPAQPTFAPLAAPAAGFTLNDLRILQAIDSLRNPSGMPPPAAVYLDPRTNRPTLAPTQGGAWLTQPGAR